jgi:hypothetical protein
VDEVTLDFSELLFPLPILIPPTAAYPSTTSGRHAKWILSSSTIVIINIIIAVIKSTNLFRGPEYLRNYQSFKKFIAIYVIWNIITACSYAPITIPHFGQTESCTYSYIRRYYLKSILILPSHLHVVYQVQSFFSCFLTDLYTSMNIRCRSQWPSGLKHELSSLVRTLGSWVRIPLKARMPVCAIILCLCCPVCR